MVSPSVSARGFVLILYLKPPYQPGPWQALFIFGGVIYWGLPGSLQTKGAEPLGWPGGVTS